MAWTSVTTGSLNSVSNGPAVDITAGKFVVEIFGTFAATIRMERRADGTNWVPIDIVNEVQNKTAPDVFPIVEPFGAQYRVACTNYTSGTVNWRIEQR